MSNRSDEDFENRLRAFRPLRPAPLPPIERRHTTRNSFSKSKLLYAFACMTVILVLTIPLARNALMPVGQFDRKASALQVPPPQPLTMQEANELLDASPSYELALDRIALPYPAAALGPGKRSAVEVLADQKGAQ